MAEKLIEATDEKVTLNKRAAELLLWKLSILDAYHRLFSYTFYGAGWDGQSAKPPSKKALLRGYNYLQDLQSLTDIPASVPMKDGSIWFEDEKGEVHAICTDIGTLIKDRKEIDKYIGKVYGK